MCYVALDFETANRYLNSACALGMVKFDKDGIFEEFFTFIKPPYDYFDPININIHGIHYDDVKDSPRFDELWGRITDFIGDNQVMAHNAGFDMGVLGALLKHYDITDIPPIKYFCTWQLSKKLYPDLPSRSLDSLAKRIGFDFKHHNALEDAKACAEVFLKMESEIIPDKITSVMHPKKFVLFPEADKAVFTSSR